MFQISIILLCFQLYFVSCNDLYSKFQQHDYKVEFTRLEMVNYSKDVYERFDIVTFKYNRSLAVANITILQKVQMHTNEICVIHQAFKFASNEYRLFPLRFQLNLCQIAAHNIAGVFDIMTRCGNIRDCHFKKGVIYHVCNIYPDQSRFPPLIPTGEYKLELAIVEGDLTLAIINAYGKVYRPIKIK